MDRRTRRLESELCKAVNDGDPRSVQLLLSQGARADVVDGQGVAAIHLAVGKETEKNLRCLKILLQHGADPNVKSSDGLTPLHVAAVWGCYQNLKLLLMNGGNPHMKDNEGFTPWQLAEREENRKCAQLLQERQRESGDAEDEELPRFTYAVYSNQTDESCYPDSEFSFRSYSSKFSDCPLSSTRRSSFFNYCNLNERPNGRGLSQRPSDLDERKRCSQEWSRWTFEGPSILSSTRLSTAGVIGPLPVFKEDNVFTVDRTSPSKSEAPQKLHSIRESRKSVSFRDVDEYFPVFSPDSHKELPEVCDEGIPQSLPFDPTEYSDFLDMERMATVSHTQGIDVTSPDHVYVFHRDSSESTEEDLEKTVINHFALHERAEEDQETERVEPFRTEKKGSGSSSGTTSSHYSSCDSDHYTSALEGPNLKQKENCSDLDLTKKSTEKENGKCNNPQTYEAYPHPGSECEKIDHVYDSFEHLSLSEAKHQNNDATTLCNVSDEVKPATESTTADQFDRDLSFTPSPFITGRTRSRLSRCSMRNSKTSESVLGTSTLFEDILPPPVRSRRQTPRSQSSGRNYNDIFTGSPSAYYTSVKDTGQADSEDMQPSLLRASSSVCSCPKDTIILPKDDNDSLPCVKTPDDTFILTKESSLMDDYERNFAEIVKEIQKNNQDNKDFLTDDLTSTDEAKSSAISGSAKPSQSIPKEDASWMTEDCVSQPETVSSSSSSSYFSPRRSREGSDPPCTPGTGCTPRYSMSRLSGLSRPRSLANISYTPGGRPLINDVDEPVEFLYTDTEQGHKLIETHIPPTANTSLSSNISNTSSEETILYDWRSMHKDVIKNQDKENQPQAVHQKASICTDVDVLTETKGMTDKELRIRLLELGESPGPISSRTRPTYIRRLCRLLQESNTQSPNGLSHAQSDSGYSQELCRVLKTFQLPPSQEDEQALWQQFEQPDQNQKWREGFIKSSFNYLLLDPRVTNNLPFRSHTMSSQECFKTFVNAVFYVGKGKRSRPYSHLYEALEYFKGEKSSKKLCRKVEHILQVWNAGQGVISLHCFQNVIPAEAYTREACMVDAIGLKMLSNQKRGDYYGIASKWPQKRKKELGIHLLYRAMQIFLAEGERQLRPADIRQ